MDWQIGLGVGLFVYLAFVFDLFGFLARDELWLRLLMLAASGLYLACFSHVAEAPLWDAISTDVILASANLAMICVVPAERSTLSMSADHAALSRHFPMLNPGQFRRLYRAGQDQRVDAVTVLTEAGTRPDRLFYVVEGKVLLDKGGAETALDVPLFIRELAFLTYLPATATVRIEAGARYLSWPGGDLRRLLARSSELNVALQAEFNRDLVGKVARSLPRGAL